MNESEDPITFSHEKALTPREVAKMLNMPNVQVVRRHMREKLIPAFKQGNQWRSWPSQIRAYTLAQQATAPVRMEDPWSKDASLRMPARAVAALASLRVESMEDLASFDMSRLDAIKNCGAQTREAVRGARDYARSVKKESDDG